jgi:hypothetical protein
MLVGETREKVLQRSVAAVYELTKVARRGGGRERPASMGLCALRHASHSLLTTHLEKQAGVLDWAARTAVSRPWVTGAGVGAGAALLKAQRLRRIHKAVGQTDEASKKLMEGVEVEARKKGVNVAPGSATPAWEGGRAAELRFLQSMRALKANPNASIIDYAKAYAPSVLREAGIGGGVAGLASKAGQMYAKATKARQAQDMVSAYGPAAAIGGAGLLTAAAM